MKLRSHGLFFALAGLTLLLGSCGSSTSGNPYDVANPSYTVTGTVTVDSSLDGTKVKVGLFSNDGKNSIFCTNTISSGTNKDYRFYYYDSGSSDTSVALTPVTSTAVSVSSGGSQTYSLSMPSPIPASGTLYYFVAWIDTDGDGKLDLPNSSDPSTVISSGEFARVAWRLYSNDEVTDQVARSSYFCCDELGLNPNVWWTYCLYGNYVNNYDYLTIYNDAGYTFNMVPVSGSVGYSSTTVTGW